MNAAEYGPLALLLRTVLRRQLLRQRGNNLLAVISPLLVKHILADSLADSPIQLDQGGGSKMFWKGPLSLTLSPTKRGGESTRNDNHRKTCRYQCPGERWISATPCFASGQKLHDLQREKGLSGHALRTTPDPESDSCTGIHSYFFANSRVPHRLGSSAKGNSGPTVNVCQPSSRSMTA